MFQKAVRIREGGGHPDLIQDLLERAVLRKKYPKPSIAIGVDTTTLQAVRTIFTLLYSNSATLGYSLSIKITPNKVEIKVIGMGLLKSFLPY